MTISKKDLKEKNAVDWTGIFKIYAGKWVVLDRDEETVLSSAGKPKVAWEKALKKTSDGILLKVPSETICYFGPANEF